MSKPRKTSPPPPLHFITITEEPESMKSEFSYAVRSHAMQSFIHEKNNPKPKQEKSGISQSSDSNDQVRSSRQLSGRFKLSTWSRKSRKKAVRVGEQKSEEVETAASLEVEEIETGLNSGLFRPYDGALLPISVKNVASQQLMYHYNTAFISNAFAVNYDNTWKPFSITDSALLHATLGLTAQHRDLLHGCDDSSENLYHKGEAMKVMTRRLTKESHRISDADVTCVALLVVLESTNGTFEAATAHRVGLLKMIKVRGGYLSFESHHLMLRVLAWSDIAYSTRFNIPPAFPCLFSSCSFEPQSSEPADAFDAERPTSPPWFRPDSETLSILTTLRNMSLVIDHPNLTLNDKKSLVDALYNVQYRILTCLHSSTQLFTSSLEQAFQLASLVYLHLFIRDLPNLARLHDNVLSYLTALLKSTAWQVESQKVDSEDWVAQWRKDVLLWIVFVAIAASRERTMRVDFVMAIRGAEPGLIWSEMDDVKVRLERVVWRERRCLETLKVIWKEMKSTESWY